MTPTYLAAINLLMTHGGLPGAIGKLKHVMDNINECLVPRVLDRAVTGCYQVGGVTRTFRVTRKKSAHLCCALTR